MHVHARIIMYRYTSSRNACMPLVEIASRDVHYITTVPSRDTNAFMNIHVSIVP